MISVRILVELEINDKVVYFCRDKESKHCFAKRDRGSKLKRGFLCDRDHTRFLTNI